MVASRRIRTTFLTLLLGAACLAGPAQAAPPQEAAAELELQIPPEWRDRRGPDGISYPEALKRTLVYHSGATQVMQESLGLLIEAEMERRRAAGEDLSWIEITDEEVDDRIATSMSQFSQANPHADFWQILAAQGYDKHSYPKEVRRTLLLDQLFFPDDPDRWPEIDKEIFPPDVRTDDTGAEVLDEQGNPIPVDPEAVYGGFLQNQYERLVEAKTRGGSAKVDDNMKQLLLRGVVIGWLNEQYEIVEPFDGLSEGIALKVAGKPVATDKLLDLVAPRIGPVELERAAMWVEVTWKVAEALKKDGVLLSHDEAVALMEEEMEEYVNSPISYEQMATEFLGFPSMQAYKEHFLLRSSYRKLLPDPFPKEVLLAQRDKRMPFFGRAKVDAEVIYFAAIDQATNSFPREGDPFGDAEERARAAAKQLGDGAGWTETLLACSDYPVSFPGAHPSMPKPNRGRFGYMERVPLRDMLGENDYPDFLLGYSLGDHMFYDAEIGAVYGPVRGIRGWYIYRVMHRTEPKGEIDPFGNERHKFLVNDSYLTDRFMQYVAEVMGRS